MAAPAFEKAAINPIVWPRTDVGNGSVAIIKTVLHELLTSETSYLIQSII